MVSLDMDVVGVMRVYCDPFCVCVCVCVCSSLYRKVLKGSLMMDPL